MGLRGSNFAATVVRGGRYMSTPATESHATHGIEHPTSPAPAPAPVAAAATPQVPRRRWWLWLLCIAAIAAAAVAGRPWVIETLNTVSTDDAYVNSHVTFVAARVSGQVATVLVDDNNRVRKDDLLVQLDSEPYQKIVNIKQAMVATAQADLIAAQDDVRGMVALARSNRFKLLHAMEDVRNQVALLRANVAGLETKRAVLVRAKADLERGRKLVDTGTITREEFDQRQEAAQVGEAQV